MGAIPSRGPCWRDGRPDAVGVPGVFEAEGFEDSDVVKKAAPKSGR